MLFWNDTKWATLFRLWFWLEKRERTLFCVQIWVQSIEYTKTLLSLYFLPFNNLHTVLKRIVSQFRIFIQNQNLITAVWSVLFAKYNIITDSSSVHFVWFCLNVFSKSESDYCSSNGDNFLCLSLRCTLRPFHLEEGRWYFNDPQPAALGLIGNSWSHQNHLCPAAGERVNVFKT